MCGCGRSKAKSFNQRRNTKIISSKNVNPVAPNSPKIKKEEKGMTQERRDIEKRRRQIIRKTFGK